MTEVWVVFDDDDGYPYVAFASKEEAERWIGEDGKDFWFPVRIPFYSH